MSSEREYAYFEKCDLVKEAGGWAYATYSSLSEWKSAAFEMRGLMDRWREAGPSKCRLSLETYSDPDQQLWDEFQGYRDMFYALREYLVEKEEEQWKENEKRKKELISEIDTMLASSEGVGQNTRQEYMERWKSIGHAGEAEGELWSQFRKSIERIKDYKANKKRELETVSAMRKEELIKKTKEEVAAARPNQRIRVFEGAMQNWRNLGHAGDREGPLWVDFKAIKSSIHTQSKLHKAEMMRRCNQKREIVEKAKTLLELPITEGKRSFRKLMEEWKGIGGAGKEENQLWAEFRVIGDKLWEDGASNMEK